MCHADGSEPVQLTHRNGLLVGSPRWSPDGTRIAYDGLENGHSAIFVMDLLTRLSRVFAGRAGDYMMPTWSRDLLYCPKRRQDPAQGSRVGQSRGCHDRPRRDLRISGRGTPLSNPMGAGSRPARLGRADYWRTGNSSSRTRAYRLLAIFSDECKWVLSRVERSLALDHRLL
jgi:hypothetical protein